MGESKQRISPTDQRILTDLAGCLECGRQLREGWYSRSCFEQGLSSERSCVGCRVLLRVQKRLVALTSSQDSKPKEEA